MNFNWIDISIIIIYISFSIFIGFWISKKAGQNLQSYFLGGTRLKWYYLGLSNGSGMLQASGCAIAILGQFMGVNAVLYYGPSIFETSGLSSGDSPGNCGENAGGDRVVLVEERGELATDCTEWLSED